MRFSAIEDVAKQPAGTAGHGKRMRRSRQRGSTTTGARENARPVFEPEDMARMLADQGSACSICEQDIHIGPGDGCCVDHDHKTGAVRGLLCRKCNVILGQAADSPDVLRAAADYLERHGADHA